MYKDSNILNSSHIYQTPKRGSYKLPLTVFVFVFMRGGRLIPYHSPRKVVKGHTVWSYGGVGIDQVRLGHSRTVPVLLAQLLCSFLYYLVIIPLG
jgi:hypothetical protein